MSEIMIGKMLTVKEFISEIDIALTTFNRMKREKQIPVYMKIGRQIRFDRKDVERWKDQRKAINT